MLFPDLGDARIPLTEGTGQRGLMACQPFPRAAYLAEEGISPTTGPGREGKKDAQLEHVHCAWCVQ